MEGWIKQHRKILDHYLFKEKRVFSKFEAWTYILLMANHKENKFLLGNELIELKPGQLITSQSKLMETFSWSKSKLKGFFDLLESDSMLKVSTDSKKTTLTIVKYRDYQELETAKRPQKDRQQSASSLRVDTNKNVNNDIKNDIKNEKKNKPKKSKKIFQPIIYETLDKCLPFFDEYNHPKTEKQKEEWLDVIDKLNRLDGLEFDDIIHLVQKTREDNFWCKNFLTITKLRKKNKDGVQYWNVFFNNVKENKNGNKKSRIDAINEW